jgi:hypothetical protein
MYAFYAYVGPFILCNDSVYCSVELQRHLSPGLFAFVHSERFLYYVIYFMSLCFIEDHLSCIFERTNAKGIKSINRKNQSTYAGNRSK